MNERHNLWNRARAATLLQQDDADARLKVLLVERTLHGVIGHAGCRGQAHGEARHAAGASIATP